MEEIDITDPELRPLSGLGDAEAWAMVEASPDGMILADQHGVMLLVNRQIEVLFGFDRGELLGREVEELLPERFRAKHTAHRTRYRAKPVVRAMGSGLDLWATRKDGTEFPVEVSLSPLATREGLRVVATVRDVHKRVADDAHKYAVLHAIDRVHDGVFMFDAESLRFEYVNQGAVNQLGYSHRELLEMSPLHIKPLFTEASFREVLETLVKGEVESQVITTVHRRKDGFDIPVEIILEYPPPPPGPDQRRMVVALVRDATDRLAADEAVRAKERAQGRLEDRERLARDLHDVIIQQLFASGMGLQSVHRLIQDEAAAKRVMDTVDQLDHTIAQLRAAIFHLTAPLPGTPTSQIEAVVSRAALQLGFEPELDIDDAADIAAGPILDHLLPTLTEALSNVVRHASASRVSVSVRRVPTRLELQVVDNGVGFDPETPRGNGLANLSARAKELGGMVTITSGRAGSGTMLRWTAAT